MEPRFGHDFSAVRVHVDARAAESARAVGAVAYTVGNHIAVGTVAPTLASSQGRRLLAHELTHVIQQDGASNAVERIGSVRSPAEEVADEVAGTVSSGGTANKIARDEGVLSVRRTVGRFNCAPEVFGAPADPLAAMGTADGLAQAMAQMLADNLGADAHTARGGIPAAPSDTFQTYQTRFGLPNAQGRGFLNRLTGIVRPTLEVAAGEELTILSRRFALVGRLFSQPIDYLCPRDAAAVVNLPPWAPGACGTADAMSGASRIALCAGFWNNYDANDFSRAAILIHESFHMIWDRPGGGHGQIGDAPQPGPGGNFNVAGCYEGFVDDFFGINSGVSCPAIHA